jgi:hypothetical protein
MKSITKGLKTLPRTRVDKIRGEGGPASLPTKIQQKRTCLQIPAQSRISQGAVIIWCEDDSIGRFQNNQFGQPIVGAMHQIS